MRIYCLFLLSNLQRYSEDEGPMLIVGLTSVLERQPTCRGRRLSLLP